MATSRGISLCNDRIRHRTGAAVLVIIAALCTLLIPADRLTRAPQHSPTERQGAQLPPGTPHLPINLPPPASLRASKKLVFAHYLPSLPVSIDNRPAAVDYYTEHYLKPTGEFGKHRAYGGFVRDRPIPRAPIPSRDWLLRDMETEVRQAIAAGVDGFSLDLLELPNSPGNQGAWRATLLMLQAAQNVDPQFKIMLMPDMAATGGTDVAALAKYVAQLAAYPSAFHLPDGRLVVAPFLAEAHPPAWWSQFIAVMRDQHRIRVAFTPVLLDNGHSAAFAGISHGLSEWGTRNPAWNDPLSTSKASPLAQIGRVRALGRPWMQPVSVQDERPRAGVFQEAANSTNLRNTWQVAIRGASDWVQLTTWNDYAEGSHVAPSAKHGWSYLDMSAYYLAWFKTGAPPKIVRDALYLTHRTQPVTAKPSYPQTRLMAHHGGTPARDNVEVLAFLTKPATITVTSGTASVHCAAPAGVSICTAPLSAGVAHGRAHRGSATVARVTSPFPVTNTPYVQDLQYVAAGSLRTTVSPAPAR